MDVEMIRDTAARMLERYRTVDKATAAATDHALDYPTGHQFRIYWMAVRDEIRRQYRERNS